MAETDHLESMRRLISRAAALDHRALYYADATKESAKCLSAARDAALFAAAESLASIADSLRELVATARGETATPDA